MIEGASQVGCIFTETHPARSPNAGTGNQSKYTETHPTLMFHYPSELPHWWGRRGLALSWNAVIRRTLP
jgi:hypothetical protein